MKRTSFIWLVAVSTLAAATAGAGVRAQQSLSRDNAPFMTPEGITIQEAASTLGTRAAVLRLFADAKGMTLYTYDKDMQRGKSACTGDCVAAWPAATAPGNASVSGDWSIIAREDGVRQWAYRDKPLYRFAAETEVGSTKGDNVDEVWHRAEFQPMEGLVAPYGISVRDVPDAGGQVLVDNRGLTLYAFNGDLRRDLQSCRPRPCVPPWVPVSAPQLAHAVGDFSIATRADGTRQWAYRGQPLYRFAGDLITGTAKGIGVDTQWRVARLMRYFVPSNVVMGHRVGRGSLWTTPAGFTLYMRNRDLPFGLRPKPATGRAIGTSLCDAECLETWRPLRAPPDAWSRGYWEVATRDDGTRQWAYKGFALYTYAGDKNPGDVTGEMVADIIVGDEHKYTKFQIADGASTGDSTPLYWQVARP